jgi:thiol-disulfide isomerase/thioredoxin
VVAALALLAAGCGNGDGGGARPDYAAALAGAPAPLAGLHEQANEILPGGRAGFERRLSELEGYPVVANVWASWCGPCRAEFPHFQEVAAEYGKRVAFVGVDTDDSADAASTFLEQYPVPYPSYDDPAKEIWEALELFGLPATAYYGRDGELVHLKQGPYESAAELEADLRRYALRS